MDFIRMKVVLYFDNTQQQYQKILRDNGYTTALFGKWHLFSDPAGFDYYKIHANASQQGTYWDPIYSTNGRKTKRERLCHETYHDLCFAMA